MAANLTSPTNEFPATKERSNSGDDTIEKKADVDSKGSIVGLRSSKFANLEKRASPSPEPKPRNANAAAANEDSSTPLGPKPKPLPKPRPWSIVGVDRKSGEVTSVTNSGEASGTVEKSAGSKAGSSVRDLINNMNKEQTTGTSDKQRKGSSLPRGSQPPQAQPSDANSPKLSKKTDSTSDDPRILKLEDDYAYEGVMDV